MRMKNNNFLKKTIIHQFPSPRRHCAEHGGYRNIKEPILNLFITSEG